MYRLILWGILILLLVRAVSRLMRGMLQGAGYTREAGSKPSVALVKDPVCGVFVPQTKALTSGSGSEMQYFCSEKCRQAWRGR